MIWRQPFDGIDEFWKSPVALLTEFEMDPF
jgi:hypothetical protein